MAKISLWRMDWNSNDAIWWNNGSDTSITYDSAWPTGKSAVFSNSGDEISLWASTNLDIWNLSISYWINTSSAGSNWVYKNWSWWNQNVWTFETTFLSWDWGSGSATVVFWDQTDWEWQRIVCTRDGTNLRVYINWVEDSNSPTASSNLWADAENKYFWDSAGFGMVWSLSEASIDSSVLSNAEIKNDYAYWKWFF